MNSSKIAPILVEVPFGELLDKITILEIKRERIPDPAKVSNVDRELRYLCQAWEKCELDSDETHRLRADLKTVNECLWSIEDEIREFERTTDFGPRFIELARAVYINNDRRAHIKRQINELLNSRFIEEKSYNA